jgi:hypothetical protein
MDLKRQRQGSGLAIMHFSRLEEMQLSKEPVLFDGGRRIP